MDNSNRHARAERCLSTRLAIRRYLPAIPKLDMHVEFLSVEYESPLVWRMPLSEHKAVEHKRMVVPGPVTASQFVSIPLHFFGVPQRSPYMPNIEAKNSAK
jgi:hypothetical protein